MKTSRRTENKGGQFKLNTCDKKHVNTPEMQITE